MTCSDVFCDNEPTHVMEHLSWEGEVIRWGAYCEPYLIKRIAPAAEIEAALEHGAGRQGGSFDTTRLPLSDKDWRYREFTDEERAEVQQIKAGVLAETYISPGVFEWRETVNETEESVN